MGIEPTFKAGSLVLPLNYTRWGLLVIKISRTHLLLRALNQRSRLEILQKHNFLTLGECGDHPEPLSGSSAP